MENRRDIRKSILNEPSYWIEKLNIDLYDALITYQEEKKLKKSELAAYLDISKGRLSQILNDGDSNFNTATLVNILLKLGKYPQIDFVDQTAFLANEEKEMNAKGCVLVELKSIDSFFKLPSKVGRPKIIQFPQKSMKLDVTRELGIYSYAEEM